MTTDLDINEFIRESNKIEGILRDPTKEEIKEMRRFVGLETVGVTDLIRFVCVYQPDAKLRTLPGMDVRVGSHIAPLGSFYIKEYLERILEDCTSGRVGPYYTHCRYETLHPFTDCNGRSGRALWAWQMSRQAAGWHTRRIGFLHAFYYQALANSRYEGKQ